MTTGEEKPRGPRAVSRVLELFLLLSRHRQGLGLAQISAELGVAKPTLLETLRGLCELNYLLVDVGRYRLGANAYRMASKILSAWSPPETIRREVLALAEQTHESVGFAIADWEIGQAIYTEAINSTQAVRYAMHSGIRAPLYASAAGRVLLAFADPARVDAYFARASLRPLTSATKTSHADIRANLGDIRAQGYCASFGEMLSDTAAIAVPVFAPDGQVIGALMLAAPLDRMRRNTDHFLAATIEAGHRASGGGPDGPGEA
ncbi:MAG TPA: IclR family transcriptional regulator [Novosphingobium sp.]|nr:IclR family transcriptional regulator [Novosphingobium sp.]